MDVSVHIVQDSDPGRRWHTIPAQDALRALRHFHAPGMTWQKYLEACITTAHTPRLGD